MNKLGSDYDTHKHISFIIMPTHYIVQRTSGLLGLFLRYHDTCIDNRQNTITTTSTTTTTFHKHNNPKV